MDLDKVAKDIYSLEYDGHDDDYIESCFYVAQDLYNLNEKDANKVCQIIEKKYL